MEGDERWKREDNAERQRRWRNKNKRNGLRRINFWVLSEDVEYLRKIGGEFEEKARLFLEARGQLDRAKNPSSGRGKLG